MNISYNGNYIFNVDMIEVSRENKIEGFDGYIIHKGNHQICVNLKHHIEKYVKNLIKIKKIQDVSSERLKEIIDDLIYMFIITMDEKIESILYDNSNEILFLNYEMSEYVSNNIEKYLGGKNGKSK